MAITPFGPLKNLFLRMVESSRLRQRLILIFLVILPTLLLVGFPVFLLFGTQLWPEYLTLTLDVFKSLYFNIFPGALVTGLLLLFQDKISIKGKKGQLHFMDFLWVILLVASFIAFFVMYTLPVHSHIRQVRSIIPGLSSLAPDLPTFLLWQFFYLFLNSFYFFYLSVDRMGLKKIHVGSFFISLSVAMAIAIGVQSLGVFNDMEEVFISLRYAIARNPASKKSLTGPQFCAPPADLSKEKTPTVFAGNPPYVRDDIEILGISNKTIEQLKGNWPLDWNIYAELTNKLSGAKGNILLFDISFLDEKGIYGGGNCGILFKCEPLKGANFSRQNEALKTAIQNAGNIVISDYPIETNDESKSEAVNYEERLKLLKERNRLKHIHHGRYAELWGGIMPLPPALSIEKVLHNMGYANVLKDERGYNRWIPLVTRIVNRERAGKPGYNPDLDDDYYPSIDLTLAAEYYGVDLQEDTEVDYLEGWVKIKNIPQKTYKKLNRRTFEMQDLDIMAKPNEDRTITIPINRMGQMDINFRGGRYCFEYKELLETTRTNADQAAANFANKITLVAMYYATGVGTAKDTHLSPYGDMAGIEHHAYAINTILNQDFTHNATPLVNLLILLGFAIAMGIYQSRVSTLMNFLLWMVLAALVFFVSIFITFDISSYIHVFPSILMEMTVILVAFIGFRILSEEENVKFIRNTFSKFVSHDVVEELLANPDAISLGGSKKEVSVFFSDVRGFTTISEALGPEDLVKLLNEYLTEMTELIIDYQGTIDKYMGDAIMAFWGAPVKNDDHAYFACVAAISQARKLLDLQKRWAERNIPVLDIGIGINTGQAVVGNMGSSRRMDYTLMGDTVNLGSRLEGVTKTYGVKICISEFTYERVKERVYARELDLVRVKGKLEPVRIYELMGLKDDSDLEKLHRIHLAGH